VIEEEDWTAPTDLKSAHNAVRILRAQIEEADAQLGDRVRRQDTEYRVYYKWRQQVKWFRSKRLQELRLTKQWIKDHRNDYKESESIRYVSPD
jgi:hypothetical protein